MLSTILGFIFKDFYLTLLFFELLKITTLIALTLSSKL